MGWGYFKEIAWLLHSGWFIEFRARVDGALVSIYVARYGGRWLTEVESKICLTQIFEFLDKNIFRTRERPNE